MEQIILAMPHQFAEGRNVAQKVKISGQFNEIVICGMGGSALSADLLKIFLAELQMKIPVHLSRDYSLHFLTSSRALIIAVSYSGNTEETISAYQEAKQRNLTRVVISRNGILEKLAHQNQDTFLQIPNFKVEPRFAVFGMLGMIAQLLANIGVASPRAIEELAETVSGLKPTQEQPKAQEIAKKLFDKIPLVYCSQKYKAIGFNWKLKFNETAQIPAFANYFSELNHNEMVGFSNLALSENFFVLMLQASDDHPRVQKRIALTAKLLLEKGVGNQIISLGGKNIFERVLRASLLGEWLSFYLASHYKTDPTSSALIEEFKKRLG